MDIINDILLNKLACWKNFVTHFLPSLIFVSKESLHKWRLSSTFTNMTEVFGKEKTL